MRVFTIGHSTRQIDEFVALLRSAEVLIVADIRTIPRSRRNPQYDGESLRSTLAAHGIRYEHIAELGGLRRARKDSKNTAWRNASFRGYADYLETPAFEAGLTKLRAYAAPQSTAIMCAEAVPWRCHRSLVADVLTARGAHVLHIVGHGPPAAHRMTAFARVEGNAVTYPGEAGRLRGESAP